MESCVEAFKEDFLGHFVVGLENYRSERKKKIETIENKKKNSKWVPLNWKWPPCKKERAIGELVDNQYALSAYTETIPGPQVSEGWGGKGKGKGERGKGKVVTILENPSSISSLSSSSIHKPLSMDRLVIFVATTLTLFCVPGISKTPTSLTDSRFYYL